MEIRTLHYFVETVRLHSFSRAAEVLHVTQSAISKQVRYLEEELDAQLIMRQGRSFTLTEMGALVFNTGVEILNSVDKLQKEISNTKTLQAGHLSIGIPAMINVMFSTTLKQYREQYPDITMTLQEGTGPGIEKLVEQGVLELGLTVLPCHNDALSVIPIATFPIYVVGTKALLPAKQSALSIEDIKELPWVLLTKEFGLRRILDQFFMQYDAAPKVVAESAQWDWLVAMAATGMGVTLLPEPFLARLNMPDIVTIPLMPHQAQWQVAYITKGDYLSHAAKAWLALSSQHISI